jgi:hypothetical protein
MLAGVGFCYALNMTVNNISAKECFIEDYGWDAVLDSYPW